MSPTRWRANLIDLIAMIAATAVGFGLSRWLRENRLPILPRIYLDELLDILVPILAAWSLSLLALGLRRSRRIRRDLFRSPGMVACGVAILVIGMESVVVLPVILVWGSPFGADFHLTAMTQMLPPIGAAVAASWGMQVLNRRWRVGPSWIDRLGCLVGVCWIFTFLIACGIGTWQLVRWNSAAYSAPPLP